MNFNNKVFESAVRYIDADTQELQILRENKGRTGIYQWSYKETGKIYRFSDKFK